MAKRGTGGMRGYTGAGNKKVPTGKKKKGHKRGFISSKVAKS